MWTSRPHGNQRQGGVEPPHSIEDPVSGRLLMEGEDSATARLRLAIGEALECGGSTPLSIPAERSHALWLRERRVTFPGCSGCGPLRGQAKAASSRRTP